MEEEKNSQLNIAAQAFDEEMCQSFPHLYADRYAPMTRTAMCWGFNIGPGWYDIIRELSAKLETVIVALKPAEGWPCYCSKNEAEHPWFDSESYQEDGGAEEESLQWEDYYCDDFQPDFPRASQVKEKFGGLRFYMTGSTEEMGKLIDAAEDQSLKTCESCGAPGKNDSDHGWYRTLCEDHWQEIQKEDDEDEEGES